ncbi:MAG: hydroxyphenylacetyl-CoA thioesterase PaaI [Mycobacteriales bacterium]
MQRTDEMYARDVASQTLGIQISDISDGRATATMTVTRSMVQGHGTCHGGYLFLLADTAFAFACNTGRDAVASGADVEFLAPAYEGDVLVAMAQERVTRGRSGIYDATVRRGDEVVVEFRGRSREVRT